MIIALEGASAIGKSTTARELSIVHGLKVIPEVNELFDRTSSDSEVWYLERQIDRWKMALEVSKSGGMAVLDGDVFQPLWYNFIFSKDPLQPIDLVIDFYRSALVKNKISFPDIYFILTSSMASIRNRKDSDPTRKRDNFDKHTLMIEPQKAYFRELKKIHNEFVNFIVHDDISETLGSLKLLVNKPAPKIDKFSIFNAIEKYIENVSLKT
jgi:deoxyadenosine/deoxycytidine kinase